MDFYAPPRPLCANSNVPLTPDTYYNVMRIIVFFLLCLLLGAADAHAALSDAREVARLNNCTPKKVEAVQQTLGATGNTLYRVECTLPKSKDDSAAKTADAVLIQCDGSICGLLRPLVSENK